MWNYVYYISISSLISAKLDNLKELQLDLLSLRRPSSSTNDDDDNESSGLIISEDGSTNMLSHLRPDVTETDQSGVVKSQSPVLSEVAESQSFVQSGSCYSSEGSGEQSIE